MLIPRVMPCLLLKEGSLVKTIKFKDPGYIGDPINAVNIYNEKEVDELIFLDINATLEHQSPPFSLLAKIANECFMPVTYGGGVRDLDDIKKIFSLGIEKVAINSYAFDNPNFIHKAAEKFGSQSIVVSIDARKKMFGKYEVYSHGGRTPTGVDPVKYATEMANMGAGEILLTAVDRDGTLEGYDLDLIKRVTETVNIPVIANGGAGKAEDFHMAIFKAGASACAAGAMVVYYGRNRAVLINFPERQELEQVLNKNE